MTVPLALRGHVGAPARAFDLLLHRAPGGEGLVIELEPAGPPVDLGVACRSALQTVLGASSLRRSATRRRGCFAISPATTG